MLDKINRLMHYKPVGRLEIYLEDIIMKPADEDNKKLYKEKFHGI